MTQRSASIQQAASVQDAELVTEIADAWWGCRSYEDAVTEIGRALNTGMKHPSASCSPQTIWEVDLIDCNDEAMTAFFIGTEAEILQKINDLSTWN